MTQKEKQALREWEEFHKSFARDALVDHSLTAVKWTNSAVNSKPTP